MNITRKNLEEKSLMLSERENELWLKIDMVYSSKNRDADIILECIVEIKEIEAQKSILGTLNMEYKDQ